MFGSKKKRTFVVKKRTPDEEPYVIPKITEKEEKKEEALPQFVSAVYGRDVDDDVYIPQGNKIDVSVYDAFREQPIGKPKDDYSEFAMVKSRRQQRLEEMEAASLKEKQEEEIKKEEKVEEPVVEKKKEDVIVGFNHTFNKDPNKFTPLREQEEIKNAKKYTDVFGGETKDEESSNEDSDDREYINDLIYKDEPKIYKYDDENTKKQDSSLLEEMFESSSTFEDEEDEVPVKKTPSVKEENTVIKEEPKIAPFEEEQFEDETVENTEEKDPMAKDEDGFTYEQRCILNAVHKSRKYDYKKPPMSLLDDPVVDENQDNSWIQEGIDNINAVLKGFRIDGHVVDNVTGPTFTQFAIDLAPGIPGSRLTSISADLQRYLQAPSIRILNPIPGRPYIGIEVPNKKRRSVSIKELVNRPEFLENKDPLSVPIGLDVGGNCKMVSISSLPHALVAGASGSGKSVFLNSIITSLLYKNSPEEVRFFFIDPKRVDLSKYKNIPHLLCPVVSDTKQGVNAVKWLSQEMYRRLSIFETVGCSKLSVYKEIQKTKKTLPNIPYIVAIIDECGDFLMNGGKEAQEDMTKLIQLCRATGIHLFLAMQKPVASILSSAIKSNATGRFAFKVSSMTDSMVILDDQGAETLLGRGDMIFKQNELGRYQAAYIDDFEVDRIIAYVEKQGPQDFFFEPKQMGERGEKKPGTVSDDMFFEVARFVVNEGKYSTNQIGKKFGMGFNRVSAIAETLEYYQIIGPNLGTKPRTVNVTKEELEEILGKIENGKW